MERIGCGFGALPLLMPQIVVPPPHTHELLIAVGRFNCMTYPFGPGASAIRDASMMKLEPALLGSKMKYCAASLVTPENIMLPSAPPPKRSLVQASILFCSKSVP